MSALTREQARERCMATVGVWTANVYDERPFSEVCVDLILSIDAAARREAAADTARLDWLEELIWSSRCGNGICFMPLTNSLTNVNHVSIEDIGDEDGSSFSDELADGLTICQAIDAARIASQKGAAE